MFAALRGRLVAAARNRMKYWSLHGSRRRSLARAAACGLLFVAILALTSAAVRFPFLWAIRWRRRNRIDRIASPRPFVAELDAGDWRIAEPILAKALRRRCARPAGACGRMRSPGAAARSSRWPAPSCATASLAAPFWRASTVAGPPKTLQAVGCPRRGERRRRQGRALEGPLKPRGRGQARHLRARRAIAQISGRDNGARALRADARDWAHHARSI